MSSTPCVAQAIEPENVALIYKGWALISVQLFGVIFYVKCLDTKSLQFGALKAEYQCL